MRSKPSEFEISQQRKIRELPANSTPLKPQQIPSRLSLGAPNKLPAASRPSFSSPSNRCSSDIRLAGHHASCPRFFDQLDKSLPPHSKKWNAPLAMRGAARARAEAVNFIVIRLFLSVSSATEQSSKSAPSVDGADGDGERWQSAPFVRHSPLVG